MANDLLGDLRDTDTWMRLRSILTYELNRRADNGDVEARELLAFVHVHWSWGSGVPRQGEFTALRHRLRLVAGQLRDVIKFAEGDT